jgi:hypothetical protein
MVHALRQARRVLKTDGYLLDLRPVPVHRRVGIECDGSYQQVAVMEEKVDDHHAANRAVKEMEKAGLLKLMSRTRFDCTRRMDRFKEFQTWLQEPARLRKLRSPERLLEKLKEALQSTSRTRSSHKRIRIIVHGPIDLRVLVKCLPN